MPRKKINQIGRAIYFDGKRYDAFTIGDAEALEGVLNLLEDERLATLDELAQREARIHDLRNEIGALVSRSGVAVAVADRLGRLLLESIDGSSVEGAIARRYVEDQLELLNIADRASGGREEAPRR